MEKAIHPRNVWFDDAHLWVEFTDNRKLGIPIAWFPRLHLAKSDKREKFELSADGIHWPELNEDISIEGLLAGRGDLTTPQKQEISVYDIKDLGKYLDTRLERYVSKYDLTKAENDKLIENCKKGPRRQIIIGLSIIALILWLEILTLAVMAPHH